MIAFDNGPAHGDYVRYIDDLMARAALAAPAVVASDGDMASGVAELIRGRATGTPTRSSNAGAADDEWSRTASSTTYRTPAPASSGFAVPTTQSPAAAAASAVASALMSGQVGRGAALSAATLLALVAIVVGALLVLIGLLVHPFNLAVVAGGGVLIAWAFRRLKAAGIGAIARRRST